MSATAVLAKIPCAAPGCEETVEIEMWDGWEKSNGAYRRIIENTAHCPPHAQAAVEAGEEEERQKKRALYASALNYSYIPPVMRSLGWSDYDLVEPGDVIEDDKVIATQAEATAMRKAAVAAAKRWGSGELRGLVLSGRVGVGKSRLAAISSKDFIYHRIKALEEPALDRPLMPVRWVSVPDLIKKSKGEYGSDSRREAEKIMNGGSAMVLDDIDKVKPTEAALDLLFDALESRTGKGAPLLVTTNMRYPELVEHLGDPLASRIAGYCEGCRIVGEDRRQF